MIYVKCDGGPLDGQVYRVEVAGQTLTWADNNLYDGEYKLRRGLSGDVCVYDWYQSAGPCGNIPAEPARHAHTARRSTGRPQPEAPPKADA